MRKTYFGSLGAAYEQGDQDFVDLILNSQGHKRQPQVPNDPAEAVAYAEGLIGAATRFKERNEVEVETGMNFMEALLAGKAKGRG